MARAGWPPLLAAVLAVTVLGSCAAQGAVEDAGSDGDEDEPLHVVASMSIIADFARQVGGEHVTVQSLVPVGADPHVHEPRPSDARAVAEADLVLGNGVGLEPWFDQLLEPADREAVRVTEELAPLVTDDPEGAPDPHLWMVPSLATAYVERIAEALGERDPDHADDYQANAESYAARLEVLDAELAETLEAVPPERRILVTSHDAYRYFADHYGFEVWPVVGVSTDEQPSAGRVQDLVDRLRDEEVPTIFVETTVNPAVIERIARDADVAVGRPLYGDSVGEEGSDADDYAGMMRHNVAAIVDGLGTS